MPMAAALVTACSAPALSLNPRPQLGSPSVASTMNFGFVSVRPRRYVVASRTACCVGVAPPGEVAPRADWTALALLGPTGTLGVVVVPHRMSLGKKTRPHRICACDIATDMLSAAVICCHLEAPPPDGGSFIDVDLSWTMRRSGGCRC